MVASAATLVVLVISSSFAFSLDDQRMHPHLAPSTKYLKLNPQEATSAYWNNNAQKTVLEKAQRAINENVAKNVIMFLGDGMSIPTVSAARVYLGGEEAQLSFDQFPWTGLSKTYAVDRQVADSANTATAYLGGVKANYGTIGVGPEVLRGDCPAMNDATNYVFSIAYHSQQKNKKTGIVTTARVTHASPAGAYAHTANRDWESDSNMISAGIDPTECADIASQLVYGDTGKNLEVILGGGRSNFLPSDVTDGEGHGGARSDGVNLIEEWVNAREGSQFVWNRTALLDIENEATKILGLFGHDHMAYNLERDPEMDPSLAEMTATAIKILSQSDSGYFLFVEGARIDMGHHATQAHLALDETIEFSKAIQTAVDLTDESDTLIVVTSDHAHTMSYSGYAERGNDIFEFGGTGTDGKVYNTLNYANGPGYKKNDADGTRHDPSQDDYDNTNYAFPAVAPLGSETHGGDDVAIFARGPYAHLFSGVLEQNVIPHLMAYASCVGEGVTACNPV